MKLAELAHFTDAKISDEDSDIEILGAAGLDEAGSTDVTFLSNPRYTSRVGLTKAAAIYLGEGARVETNARVMIALDPYLAYTRALRLFNPEPDFESLVHPSAIIDPSAVVSDRVWIGACAVVGRNVTIGDHVKIFPNVTIYDNARIGDDTVIHSGVAIREDSIIGARVVIYNNAVIGMDGFGYAKDEEKHWLKIPQTGRVVIEDDVEIGAGTTIDKASVGETRIKRGAKIDNLVQIGHSCTVGEDALLCSQVGLAGSSVIGDRVILAGQAGVAGHLKVGDDAVITAKSATSHNVEPGKVISGIPGFDNRDWLRSTAAFRRLGDMARNLRAMAKRIEVIEASIGVEDDLEDREAT
jgi:UDP-3-O-[3-hydroxymyristoyl] glucosamine N-acyltransferase